MRSHRTAFRCCLPLAAVLVGGLACRPTSEKPEPPSDIQPQKPALVVTLYRTDEAGLSVDCGAVAAVEWTVPDSLVSDAPSVVIREVIRDVQPSSSLHSPGTKPLIEYFRGARIEGRTAILSFNEGALEYLNNAACAQIAVKTPMVRTLLDFGGVEAVEFEIEGEIFRDWDA